MIKEVKISGKRYFCETSSLLSRDLKVYTLLGDKLITVTNEEVKTAIKRKIKRGVA